MKTTVILGLVRHLLTATGGYFLAQPEMLSPAWSGLIVALGAAWSAWQKVQAESKKE